MSTLETRKIEPLSGTTVTLGAAGDAVTMPAGVTLKTNTVKDAGGNTLWTSNGSGTLSSVNSGLTGGMVFISSQTASSSASVSFTTGIDSTYDEYMFVFINIHPVEHEEFTFNGSTDGGSNYNVTKTSTSVSAYHAENGSGAGAYYITSGDLAQSTAFQQLAGPIYTDNDSNMGGELHLFNPSSTTYVKHFIADTQRMDSSDSLNYTNRFLIRGYLNTTSAIDAVQFKMTSGNFDGTIAMYGIK